MSKLKLEKIKWLKFQKQRVKASLNAKKRNRTIIELDLVLKLTIKIRALQIVPQKAKNRE